MAEDDSERVQDSVVGTYQYNRRGPGSLANIYSDAIGQLASTVIGLDDEEDMVAERLGARQFKKMELLKGRDGRDRDYPSCIRHGEDDYPAGHGDQGSTDSSGSRK